MKDLSFELHFGTDLAESDVIDRLAAALGAAGPGFAAELRVLEYERDRSAVSVGADEAGALRQAVLDKGTRRGPLLEQLATQNPPPAFPRRFGDVLLRGKARSTFLTVRFDQHAPARRSGDVWLFSNSVGGWVGTPRIDGVPRSAWVRDLCQRLADHPDFLWGAAFDVDEFRAWNRKDDATGVRALGRDVRRSLPGVFWLNLFGPPYRALIGDETLRSVPAAQVVESDRAISVELYEDPAAWSTPVADRAHTAAVEHFGPAYFFDRREPNRATSAPDFGLEELPSRPSFKVMTADGKNFTPLPDLG